MNWPSVVSGPSGADADGRDLSGRSPGSDADQRSTSTPDDIAAPGDEAARSGFAAAIAGAIVVRLVVVWVSAGSNDVVLWSRIADAVNDLGLIEAYRLQPELNHPPGPTLFMAWARALSEATAIPFTWLVKIPALAADALAAVLVYRVWSGRAGVALARRVTLAYLWCPAVIWLSAFHGNTDALYGVALATAAVLALRRPALAGLALAVAVNVKLLPIVCGPALLAVQRSWQAARRHLLAAGVAVVPFLPLLVMNHHVVIDKIVGYTSRAHHWGPSWLLAAAGGDLGAAPGTGAGSWYVAHGKVIMSVAIVATALVCRRRQVSPIASVVAAACAYLVTTPGMGVQHLALVSVVVFVADRRTATVFACAASLFTTALYLGFMNWGWPALSAFHSQWPPGSIATAAMTWAVCGWIWLRAVSGAVDQGIADDTRGVKASLFC